jgi:hypothetical protein
MATSERRRLRTFDFDPQRAAVGIDHRHDACFSEISNLRTFADVRLEGADRPRNRSRTSGRHAFGAATALRGSGTDSCGVATALLARTDQ